MLTQIAVEWDKAEKLVKRAERIRSQVVLASINELRYAGRRLVDAWHLKTAAETDDAQRVLFDRHVSDALLACNRAQHDAVDAIVLFLQKVVNKYEEEFGLALLAEKYPRIFDIKATLRIADDLITGSREHRDTRDDDYDRLADEHFPALLDHYYHLVSSRDLLISLVQHQAAEAAKAAAAVATEEAKEVQAEETAAWRYRIVVVVTVAAGGIGGLVGAVATVLLT
jgi:hypothetical protein